MLLKLTGFKMVLAGLATAGALATPALGTGAQALAESAPTPVAGGSVTLPTTPLNNAAISPDTTVNVGGGTWTYGTSYGFNGKTVTSNYYHPSLYHSSTAIIGTQDNTSYAAAGYWSYASAVGSFFDRGYAYWATY